jgi:hypothetical protein
MVNVENVQKLIDLLKALPEEKFSMPDWLERKGLGTPSFAATQVEEYKKFFEPVYKTPEEVIHNCGTAGCIGGWAGVIMKKERNEKLTFKGAWSTAHYGQEDVADWLGIGYSAGYTLFHADGGPRVMPEVRRVHAIRVLEHLLATGQVDWSEDVTGSMEDDEKLVESV